MDHKSRRIRAATTPGDDLYRVGALQWVAGFRPRWHKAVGVLLVAGGLGLFVVCELNIWHLHDHGGHIWYVVGIAVAISSTWWFGLYDPVELPQRRR